MENQFLKTNFEKSQIRDPPFFEISQVQINKNLKVIKKTLLIVLQIEKFQKMHNLGGGGV